MSSYAALLATFASREAVQRSWLRAATAELAAREVRTETEGRECRRGLDETITWLRLHQQAGERLEQLLHPRLRVYVSNRLLNEVAGIREPRLSFPLNRRIEDIHVAGCVTATGRLQVQTLPNDAYGELALRLSAPVRFCGTVQWRRISMGVDFGLRLNASQRCYL